MMLCSTIRNHRLWRVEWLAADTQQMLGRTVGVRFKRWPGAWEFGVCLWWGDICLYTQDFR
jgi:hypothetical protein